MIRTLLLLILSTVSVGFVRELPRAAEAAAREKQIRRATDSLQIQESYVDAFLNNIGDDALLLASAGELTDDLRAAIEAREQFPWARDLSDSDFLRYVLPVRISGEPVQRYRRKLLNELGEVVKNCSTAAQAALEVNLWLGQRVTFKPTDRREQGVLTTLACGFGRCGEETIIATAALRSVGIAARMAYVPFWAHQDNNHAWVEVKTGDNWSYLGACEPEATLNHAWFDEPVLRAPILCARVSDVDSTEAGAMRGTRGWQINSTANYFPPCKVRFQFPAVWSTKQDEAWISVFNYGGLLPIARVAPNKQESAVELGAGDFLLVGRHQDRLFMQKLSTEFGTERDFLVDPSAALPESLLCEFPIQKSFRDHSASESWQLRLDAARKQSEITQLRKNETPEWLADFAGADSNLSKLAGYLKNAPGNSQTLLRAYLATDSANRTLLLELLATLSEKDLREIDSLTLDDFMRGANAALQKAALADDSLREYIVSPRIFWEAPRPWRSELAHVVAVGDGGALDKAHEINRIVAKRIAGVRKMRPVDPLTAWRAGTVDNKTAAILVCGLLRVNGIPAYITEGEEWVTFHDGTGWKPLYPGKPAELGVMREQAKLWFGEPAALVLTAPPGTKLSLEENFNLVLIRDGWPDPYSEAILDYQTSDSGAALKIVPGRYLLSWGVRNARGDVCFGAREIALASADHDCQFLPLARPAEPVAQSLAEWRVPLEVRRSLSRIDSEFTLVIALAAQHEPSSRMLHAVGLIQNRSIDLVTLAGPEQEMDFERASKSALESLRIPSAAREFRNGAPYYRIIDPNGNVLAAGNGYRLDMASVIAGATHQP